MVARMLAHAIKLEWLDFSLHSRDSIEDEELVDHSPPTFLPLILGGCKYKRLRRLKLADFTFTEGELVELLQESKGLTSFKLGNPFMVRGS